MKEKLEKLLNNSYAPYSNFKVASVLVMKDGKEFYGVNVENASYGACICSERNAIATAIAAGYKKGDFEKIYLGFSSGEHSEPCFMCRQVISEFFDKDSKIISVNRHGEEKIYTVEERCPYPFDKEDLK